MLSNLTSVILCAGTENTLAKSAKRSVFQQVESAEHFACLHDIHLHRWCAFHAYVFGLLSFSESKVIIEESHR